MPIRRPTPRLKLYNWWRRSVAGERMPLIEGEPQPGYYRTRMTRGGPWVGVEIWMEQQTDRETGDLVADEVLRAVRNGERIDPLWVWGSCRPISLAEYDALTGARDTLPETMKATMVAVDLGALPPLTP